MLQKLLAIASIQDRIDLVAADYNSGADLFAEVSGHELLKALGESRNNGDMPNIVIIKISETVMLGRRTCAKYWHHT